MSLSFDALHERRIERFKKSFREEQYSSRSIRDFREIIRHFYRSQGRDFVWREERSPYHVLVSEIMLQQTQTARVSEKYPHFIQQFPNVFVLADAPRSQVLREWQGLGYNRRAVSLHQASKVLVEEFDGEIPQDEAQLITLPGIGSYTASALCCFAFNKATIFIETNIRTVFLYFFFRRRKRVADKEILPIIEQTLDRRNPRDWYYGLMDYGVKLKAAGVRLNQKSAQYRKQAPFKGSQRELRGAALRLLLKNKSLGEDHLAQHLGVSSLKAAEIASQLEREGMIERKRNRLLLPK